MAFQPTPEQQTQLDAMFKQAQGIEQQIKTLTPQVAALTSVPKPIINPAPTKAPDPTGANAEIARQEASLAEMNKQFTDNLNQATTAYQESQKGLISKYFGETKTPAQIRQETEQAMGINSAEYFATRKADLAEVQSMQEDYNKAVAAKDQALLNIENRPMPMNLIVGEQAAYEKQANIRLSLMSANINTKLGIMSAKDQTFEKAQSFVKQAVDDYTAEYKMKMDEFGMFYDINKDAFNNLTSNYKDAFKLAWDTAKTNLAQARDDMSQKLTLITDAAGKGVDLGLTADQIGNMSLFEITDIYNQKVGTEISRQRIFEEKQTAIKNAPKAPTIINGLTTDQNDAVNTEMANLQTFTTRDEAFKYLDENNTYFRRMMGEEGYVQLRQAAENKFPKAKTETTTAEPAPNPTGTGNFKETGIQDRISQLKASGFNSTQIVGQLKRDGYTNAQIQASGVGSIIDKISMYLFG